MFRRTGRTAFALAMLACAQPWSESIGRGDDPQPSPTCGEVVSTWPEDDASDVHYRTNVEVVFDAIGGTEMLSMSSTK